MDELVRSAWKRLDALAKPKLDALFAADGGRLGKLASRFDLTDGGILFDWSKTHLDDAHLAAFAELAAATGFAARRERGDRGREPPSDQLNRAC